MTLSGFRLAYEHCTSTELLDFIRQRSIVPTDDRKQMICALKEADRKATFRLLDLPRELRDEIYNYAFQTKENDPGSLPYVKAKLEILRICKQVSKEASEQFYGTQIFPLGVFLRKAEPHLFVHYNGRILNVDETHTRDSLIPWPGWLNRISCLNFRVLVAPPGDPQTQEEDDNDAELFNSALHQFFVFLSSNIISFHRLRIEIIPRSTSRTSAY
jgi:hypothetical protein